jgi:hypothetical protein
MVMCNGLEISIGENLFEPFIEALLGTSTLGSSNLRDYISGIVGIAGFPAKAMSIHEWTTARQHDDFIPIDYSADLASILCCYTWAMLMKGGLAVLAKFKAFSDDDDDGKFEELAPS